MLLKGPCKCNPFEMHSSTFFKKFKSMQRTGGFEIGPKHSKYIHTREAFVIIVIIISMRRLCLMIPLNFFFYTFFLLIRVGVTESTPMRNRVAIELKSQRSPNDFSSPRAIPACYHKTKHITFILTETVKIRTTMKMTEILIPGQ